MKLKDAALFVPKLALSLVWDVANAAIETVTLGWYPWWWKLRSLGFVLYWPGGPISIWMQEGRSGTRSMAQLSFGETPIPCFLNMLRCIEAGHDDVVVDLGCGRSMHLMAAAKVLGLRARGVDLLEGFIRRGQDMVDALQLHDQVSLTRGDISRADLDEATIVYIASTAFEPEVRDMLLDRLRQLRPGTKVITHDWMLPEADFRWLDGRDYPLSWGYVDVNVFEVSAAPGS